MSFLLFFFFSSFSRSFAVLCVYVKGEEDASLLSLLSLPDDLLISVLLKVKSARDVLRLRVVSKRLRDLIDRTELIWRYMEFWGEF